MNPIRKDVVAAQTAQYLRARDVAVEAAREAARVIRLHAGRVRHDEVRDKGTHDLVTAADEEAQRVIIDVLQAACPDYAVLAEEGPDTPYDEVVEGYRWIIDPIDGTTNFTRGVPPYSVSIGLQQADRVVVGVVLDVSRDELFTAVRGEGLYLNGTRARVSQTRTLQESLITTGFPYRAFDHVDPYLQVLRRFMHEAQGLRRPGSAAVDLAYVAAGRFDGFFETALRPWDVAAGILLIEEGGGRVTDFYDQVNPLSGRHCLASNGWLHGAMLEVLQPLRDVL